MNLANLFAPPSGAKTDSGLYPVNVIGASPSKRNETSLLVFRFFTLYFQESCYAEKSNQESRQEGR